jgi:hypothetical protein
LWPGIFIRIFILPTFCPVLEVGSGNPLMARARGISGLIRRNLI